MDVRGHVGLAGHGGVPLVRGSELAFVGLAAAGVPDPAAVRIIVLGLDSSSPLLVVVGVLGPPSVAPRRRLVAGHSLLRGEDDGGVELPHDVGLELLRGREGPAAPALPLVLHRCGEDPGPVDLVSLAVGGEFSDDVVALFVGGLEGDIRGEEEVGELLLGQVGEPGNPVHGGTSGGLLGSVAFLGNPHVLDKDLEPLALLLLAVVNLSMVHFELLPGVAGSSGPFDGTISEGQYSSENGGNRELPVKGRRDEEIGVS